MTETARRSRAGLAAALLCGATLWGLLSAGIGPARAEGDPDIGDELATHWCSNCHAVEGAARASDAAPPLATIAQKHRQDEGWLRAWLGNPHPPMPNLNLSRAEIDDVIAYLRRLAKTP